MSENATDLSERALEDQRNRSTVQALLALKEQTLMSVLRELPKDFPEKMDYPNAAAWMRGIPGRFGIKKQRALLQFLGYVNGHLDTSISHVWFPTLKHKFDPDKYESINLAVKDLFKELVNDAPYNRAYIKTPEGLPLGIAIDLAGASVLFPASNAISPSGIGMWLSSIERWHQQNTGDIELSQVEFEEYLSGNKKLDFWDKKKENKVPDDWVELVDRFIELGATPEQVWKWAQKNMEEDGL